MRRCDSAAIVWKTSELLPEPETPVNTVSRRFGMSRLTSRRLFSRAPRTSMAPQSAMPLLPHAVSIMTDYGHDLLFGTFITPGNRRPQDVVDLARLSEQVGLDLVTFQDHPYQPA